MKLEPRDYQIEGYNLLGRSVAAGNKHIVMKAPTGSGKTETAVLIINGALAKGKRVAFVAPYTVLINQTVARLAKYDIHNVGVMQGNHELTDPTQPVQVCTAQTIGRREKPLVDLVIVDECDLQYKVIYEWMEERPDVIFIGLTATPFAKGMGKYYQDLIKIKSLREFIEDKTLSDYEVYGVDEPDTSNCPVGADGDYREKELAEIMRDATLVGNVVDNWLKNGEDRQTIVFAVNVLHANDITNKFESAGVNAEVVTAKTPLEERERMFDRFENRMTRILVSVGVLIAGFDSYVDCIIFAMKTKSRRKLIQAGGRGLRRSPGKDHCLIFDHGGSISLLGFFEDIDDAFERLDDGKQRASSYDIVREKVENVPKKCPAPDCGFMKPAGVHECPKCGFKPRAGQEVDTHEEFELKKLKGKKKVYSKEEKEAFYQCLKGWQAKRNLEKKPTSDGRVAHIYREKFGCWPKGLKSIPVEPTAEVLNFIRSRNIAYAKRKNK